MAEIYSVIKSKRANVRISNNPLISERIDALCTLKEGPTFEIGNEMNDGARIINMKRFVDNNEIAKIRQDYRAIVRVRDAVLDLVLAEFELVAILDGDNRFDRQQRTGHRCGGRNTATLF